MAKVFKAVMLFSFALWVVCAKADEKPTYTRPGNVVTRMIRLQHADSHQVFNLLAGTGAQARFDDVLRVIVISGTPSDVASLEQTIHEIDSEMAKTPDSNVELTAYVLEASDGNEDAAIPSGLQSTVTQLKAAFPYRSYRSLETTVVRGSVGDSVHSSGSLHPFQESKDNHFAPPNYDLGFRLTGITNANGKSMVHIQNFQFKTGFPVSTGSNSVSYQQASLGTNLEVSTNQKVVVGKIGTGLSSLFLVIECKVVN